MKRKNLKYIFIAAALLTGLILNYIFTLPDGRLHVYFLNVGQGDSSLIRTPTNEFILVDGGPDDSVLKELGGVMPFFDRTFDLVILTHPHPDHINGLIEVLKRYEVKRVLITGVSYDYSGYREFLSIISDKHIPVTFATEKSDFSFGNVLLDVIYPFESLQGRQFENLNLSSIVFRLVYGDNEFYFPGDAEKPEEEKILAVQKDIHADVLKVAHHGSRTASSDELIDAIRPEFAVIEVGANNTFKHPHAETLDTLARHNVRVFRTDLLGTIEFTGDGKYLLTK